MLHVCDLSHSSALVVAEEHLHVYQNIGTYVRVLPTFVLPIAPDRLEQGSVHFVHGIIVATTVGTHVVTLGVAYHQSTRHQLGHRIHVLLQLLNEEFVLQC